MCNVPVPTFTARNQMTVTTTQGAQIPQKVFFTFTLRKKITLFSVTVLLLCCLSSDST